MRAAGRHGEGGGHGQHLGAGLGEVAVEAGEAQVVADGEAEAEAGGLGDDGAVARAVGGGFAVALAAVERDVEHVDLVVAGADAALRADEERAVDEAAVRVAALQAERADDEPEAELGRDGAEPGEGRVLGLRHQDRVLAGAVGGDDVRAFGRQRQRGAAGGRLADERLGRGEVDGRVVAGAELDQRRPHPLSRPEHRVEPAGPVERVDLVEAADELVADEDLRHRAAAVRAG